MTETKPPIFLLAFALAASAGVALLSGCKGNSTSAAILEKAVTPPPTMTAAPASGAPALADPLAELPWVVTGFAPFVSPLNTDRSTAPARAAVLYDANTLYVAFVCDTAGAAPDQDTVSVYLDSTAAGDGTNMAQVTIRHTGETHFTWVSSTTPAARRADGTPNFTHPLVLRPDFPVVGLAVKIRDAQDHGHKVWSAVVAIPLRQLPLPLRATAQPGARWKVNLLRTVNTDVAGSKQLLQSNLSPVFVNAQAVSPYRMADLFLSPGAMTASR